MEEQSKLRLLIEQYIKSNEQLIILISGLSGTGKKQISNKIANYFDLLYINHVDYLNKDYDPKVTLSNGIMVEITDNDKYIDWNKFNNAINENKNKGIVVSAPTFPTDLLKFRTDIHINIFISKQVLKNNRLEFIKKHPELKLNIENEMLKINAFTYTYFINSIKRSKYSISYDISKYDNLLEIIILFIKNFIINNTEEIKNIVKQIIVPEKPFNSLTNVDIVHKNSESIHENVINKLKSDDAEYKKSYTTNENILKKNLLINYYGEQPILEKYVIPKKETYYYPYEDYDEDKLAVITM
jgi:cytidylate kinase